MARERTAIESQVVEFFSSAPIEKAETVFNISKGIIRRRLNGEGPPRMPRKPRTPKEEVKSDVNQGS